MYKRQGDGHVAIKALEEYITDGCVYALDMYEPSIEDMLKYKQENNADNLIPIVSNIAEHIDLDDETLDVILMVNVFHGFKATRTLDEAVDELARVIKTDGGRIAIMDYKKQDVKNGPPTVIRSSPEDLQELFSAHGLKMTYLNEEIGEDIPEGKLGDYLSVLLDNEAKELMRDEEMINTAEEFLENSLNVSETSRNLYMHRNTLMYRLDKIERIMGLNLRKFSDAVTFRIITILYKLVK